MRKEGREGREEGGEEGGEGLREIEREEERKGRGGRKGGKKGEIPMNKVTARCRKCGQMTPTGTYDGCETHDYITTV